MPVNVRIKGNPQSNEYQDAVYLKQLIDNSLRNEECNGEILIVSNATLFGQAVKDVDLIVVGSFDRCRFRVRTKATGAAKEELEEKQRTIYVNSFCFVVETKRHRAEDVRLDGLQLLVKYNNKYHDATSQSEAQKYSLKEFLKDRLGFAPYINNFIWFRNITKESIENLVGNNLMLHNKHNYLPNTFPFSYLIELACVQQPPFNPKDENGDYKSYCSFSCLKKSESFDFSKMEEVFSVFEKVKDGAGLLTRKKIEQITSKLLDTQQYAQAIGQKLVVISGRAGTGKTIKLLRIACDLAMNHSARSLILTYNHALVSDIKRTLALAGIPDGIDNYTVSINTLHKFIYELIIGFGLAPSTASDVKHVPNFITNYDNYLLELVQCLENGLIEEKDIQELMRSKHDTIAWDYIIVDESQDWNEFEKKIIFKIFGKSKTIIADGVDQLVRSQKKCNWVQGLKSDEFKKTFEKRGLRQEVNLVSFVNEYAKQAGIVWEIEPKQELIGGKIIVSTKGYSKELHDRELKYCKDSQNAEYEMMFLVPPNLVQREHFVEGGRRNEKRKFKLTNEFKEMGISIWDLTNTDLRTQYTVDLNQHRLLQYESCRGLEGWTVVCLELDEFVRYKMETFVPEETNELALESVDEKRNKFVYLWSLIPLTRAIDTLIITIKDEKSDVCKFLKKTHERYPDFVQWIN